MMTPNWHKEQKILRLRYVLALTLISLQVTGIYRFEWWLFFLLFTAGIVLTLVNILATRSRWRWLPSLNLVTDQLITLFILAATGGALSPFVFLCYMHVMSAIVFTMGSRIVLLIGALQVVNVLASTLLAPLFGEAFFWSQAGVHSVGLLIIAALLTEPVATLHQDAQTDPLTGALNRRSGLENLLNWTERGEPFSLLFADLKHFKQVNDLHGHAIGDEVLQAVAYSLGQGVRVDDLLIRYGGDEFLVATRGDPEPISQRLHERLRKPIQTSAGEISLAVDLGTARFPQDAKDLNELIILADDEMFKVKHT